MPCRTPPRRPAARAPVPAGSPTATRAARRGSAPRRRCTTGSLREVLRQLILPEPCVGRRFLLGLHGAQRVHVGTVALDVVARLGELIVAAVRRLAADVHAAAPVGVREPVVALAVARAFGEL